VARVLLVGGGCRGLALAADLVEDGHAVRATTRTEARRAAIEAAGGECWIADPDRIGTLRYALESVTVLCWLLGTATGGDVAALHGSRLEMMLARTIDTTVRGVVYEAAGTVDREALAQGASVVRRAHETWGVPVATIDTSPADAPAWLGSARAAVDSVLAPR
jgi:nucleoside-diphosphate-sugar epimerase